MVSRSYSKSSSVPDDISADGSVFDEPPVAVLHHQPKDPRTKAKYNIFSRLFFFWMEGLFWVGCRRTLEQTNLYVHPREADSDRLLKRFNKYWAQELRRKERGGRARLWVAFVKCVWWRVILQGILQLVQVVLLVSQSVILGYLTEYFTNQEPTEEDTRDAYLLAAGLVLMSLVNMLLHAHAFLFGQKAGMIIRIIATAAIYRKILRLSQVTLNDVSIGRVVNLASNDVQRFDMAFLFIHYIWISPLHLAVFTYLVYVEVGWSAFLALGFILLQIPLQVGLARIFSKLRFKSAKVTDIRVKVMNEVISGIRVIKMYAWEYAFRRVVSRLRRSESALVLWGGILRAGMIANVFLAQTVISLLVFSVFTASGGTLTAKRLFTTLSMVNHVRVTGMAFTSRAAFTFSGARVAVSRIQKLLELPELPPTIEGHTYFKACAEDIPKNPTTSKQQEAVNSTEPEFYPKRSGSNSDTPLCSLPTSTKEDLSIKVTDFSASWSYEIEKLVLEKISIEVNKDSPLLAVVGPVGAGKSTLLQCLLGELRPVEGCVEVAGKVSYASQEAWVFSGTLRENVLFGLPYDRNWYNTVIEACALDKDISQLVCGDLTLVGERGVTLSGGQKARVSLARALYYQADVYLLDDPLSAVDTAVARHLFERVICGLLRDKLVVLVTHQVQFAQQASKILAIKDGKIEEYGSNAELLSRGVDVVRLLGLKKEEKDEFAVREDEDDEEEEAHQAIEPTSPVLRSPKRKPAIHLGDDLRTVLFQGVPGAPFDTSSIYSAHSMLSLHSAIEGGSSKHENLGLSNAPPEEEKAHGSISMATYYRYFRAGGSILFLSILFVIFVMGEVSIVAADLWLSDWADCSALVTENDSVRSTCELSNDQRLGIYSGLTGFAIVMNFARAIAFYFVCVNASRVLHNRMFASILRAPILFFDTNPIGRVLNRFSKDVGFLDDLLPVQFCEYLMLLLRFLAIMLTASASNFWILISAVVIIIMFLAIRWYYLNTSRDVKRLEAIARSPLYSHISTSLQGLPTIRTFGKESVALDLFHRYQNEHTQGWYLYLIALRWFGMRIDFLSTLFLAAVAFSSVPLASSLNAGLVGLGLTYTISLAGMFQYCVRLSAEVENIMVSAERIMAYGRLEPEAPLESLPPLEKPPNHWPDEGRIEFDEVSFRYSDDLPLVLKSLSFSVKPSEKMGIVGRTGAGKSSMLAVLFRMAEPFGTVSVDGVNSKEIGLHDLRSSISIIPQDPVLFSGTMRYNLDPFDEYGDMELWNVLEQVQLKSAVENLEGDLQGMVSEGGSNFSVGQRQLVCLARALLRQNKILVLDEATANVDNKTDAIIQEAIRDQFAECTVLTIAHRLNTIMDSDRILVLHKGQVKEFDSPYALLQLPKSQLKKMVNQTGPMASKKLYQMALDAHRRRANDDPKSSSSPTPVFVTAL